MGVLMMAGSLSLVDIVKRRRTYGCWYVFLQPLGFILFFVCGVAETNRAPFDLPEAESELVAGFHTEYSGFRFSLFFLAEYANMIVVSAMAVTLFWGGWLRPFPNVAAAGFLWIPRCAGMRLSGSRSRSSSSSIAISGSARAGRDIATIN